jgi:hypothetical protein
MGDALEYISNLQDLVDLANFMQDDDLTQAMNLAVKCIAKPNIPPSVARESLLKMQGLAFKFRMQAATYTYIHKGRAGTDDNIKKNVYFAISEQCHELAQTLKYMMRETL